MTKHLLNLLPLLALTLLPLHQLGAESESTGEKVENPDPDNNDPECISTSANQPTANKAGNAEVKAPLDNDGSAQITVVVSVSPDDECNEESYSGTVSAVADEGGRAINQEYLLTEDNNFTQEITFDFSWDDVRSSAKWDLKLDGEIFDTVNFELSECSACTADTNTCPPGTKQGSFMVTIPTQGANGGMTLGTVYFFSDDFTFPGRDGITAVVPPSFVVNHDANDLITSIDTGSGLMEFADGPGGDAITITHKDAAGNIFRETLIEQVTIDGKPGFRMDSTLTGTSTVRHEQYEDSQGKTVLQKGRVIGTEFQPIWREELTKDTSTPGVEIKRSIIKERIDSNATWQITSDTQTTWQNQLRGWVKTKEIIDPDGEALTSTWSYYQPGEITGPNGSTEGLGRLKQVVRHDGSEEFHTYELHIHRVTQPYADQVDGKTVTTAHNPGSNTTTVTTTVNGQVISKSSTIRNLDHDIQTEYTSDGESLVTTTYYKVEGDDFILEPLRIEHPDNTITTYQYTRHSGGGYTTEIENGATNDGTTVSLGMRTTTTINSRGNTIHRKVESIGYGMDGVVLEEMAVIEIDGLGRALKIAHHPESVTMMGDYATATNPAWIIEREYTCCGIAKESDRFGIFTYFAYDHLQRQIKTNRLGVTIETVRNGLTTETHRYAEEVGVSLSPALMGDTTTLVGKSVRNLAGTLRESWTPDPTSLTDGALVKSNTTATTFQPAAGLSRRTVTTTADGFTQTTDSFLDGRTAKTYGDLSPAMEYAYTVNTIGETTARSFDDAGTLRETTTTQSDWAGRNVRVDYMDGAFETMYYNSKGQLVRTVDADGIVTLFAYNTRGERTTTATDLEPDSNYNDELNNIEYGTDSINFSETIPALDVNSDPVWQTTSKVWQDGDTDSTAGTVVSTTTRTPDGLESTGQSIGVAEPSTSLTTLSGNGNWTQKITNPDDTYSVSTFTDGLQKKNEIFEIGADPENDDPIASTSQSYDPLNRPIQNTDSRTGISTIAYLSATADLTASVTDPGGRTTAFTYDIRGRRIEVDAPDTLDSDGNTLVNISTTSYFPDGNVQENSGDQTYRTTHTHNYAHRLVTMTTYGTETATTTWKYSPDRGFLTRKEYDDGKGTDYTYTAAGRLATRTWERGNHTRYTTMPPGEWSTPVTSLPQTTTPEPTLGTTPTHPTSR